MHIFSSNKTFFLKKIWWNGKIAVPLHPLLWLRSVRLSVRTRDFHSLKRSSTLLGTTTIKSAICTASATEKSETVTEGSERNLPRAVLGHKTHKL